MNHGFKSFPAIRVRGQPFGEFFLCSLPASLLTAVSYSDFARARPGEEAYLPAGTERGKNKKHASEIEQFIHSRDCVFPSSVILAANYEADRGILDGDDARRWRFVGDGNIVTIEIPSDAPIASIIDGQHRIHGLRAAADAGLEAMELPCVIYPDLPNPLQAYVFATVNFNQKKVDRGLAFELFGFDTSDDPKTWPPEKLAVFVARQLHSRPDSPLHGQVRLALRDETGMSNETPRKMSTAMLVDGVAKLYSRNSERDRNRLNARWRPFRSRQVLDDDGTPLRAAYLECNDRLIYLTVSNFLSAAQAVFWSVAPEESFIRKSVGVQALFDILKAVAADALASQDVSVEYFTSRLSPGQMVHFEAPYFQASGIGRSRVRNCLAFAMGLTDQYPKAEELDAFRFAMRDCIPADRS